MGSEEKKTKTFEVQPEAAQLEDGGYIGVITEIKYKDHPYEYVDVSIVVNGQTKVKVGYPAFLSPSSGLGKLLIRLGYNLTVGTQVGLEEFLINKHVTFVVIQQKSNKDGKMYGRILPDSVKLVKQK